MKHSDLDLDNLTDGLASVLAYWRSIGERGEPRTLQRFELMEIPAHLLPSTMVVDVFPDLERNRYRFWGTRMTRIHGRDMTGQSPYDLNPPELAAALRRKHELTVRENVPSADVLQFASESGIVHRHYALRLPLVDGTGRVAHIVVIVDFGAEGPDYAE